MNEYQYSGVPTFELTPADEKVQPLILDAVIALLNDSRTDVSAAGAHIYDRKGFYSSYPIGHQRAGYGGRQATDDLVLQITIRVPFEEASELVEKAVEVREERENEARAAQRLALDEEIAELQRRRAELD